MAKKNKYIDLDDDRYGLFMSDESFDLDVEYGRTYLETDNVQTITVFRINVAKTKKHSLYGQTKASDKSFRTAVKIRAMVSIEANQQSYLGDNAGGITREDTGNLVADVYLKELEEKNLEINRGDYVMYNQSGKKDRYYEVQSADNVTDTTDKTIGGFKPYWKRIVGVPVKEDVVPFLSETKGD